MFDRFRKKFGTISLKHSAIVLLAGNWALVLVAGLESIILIPFYLKYLGTELLGSWLALGGAVSLLSYIDLGVTTLVSQRTAQYNAAGDLDDLGAFIASALLWVVPATLIGMAIVLPLTPLIPHLFHISETYIGALIPALQLAVIDAAVILLVAVTGAFLIGLQRPGVHMVAQLVRALMVIVTTILLLQRGWGVLAIPAGLIVFSGIHLFINVAELIAQLRTILPWNKLKVSSRMFKEFLHSTFWVAPSKIAESLTAQLDSLIVLRLMPANNVTVLSITRKASVFSTMFIGRISSSLMPGLSHLHGSKNNERSSTIIRLLFIITAYIGTILLFGVILMNDVFVDLWTGPEVYGGFWLTVLVCVYALLKLFRYAVYHSIFSKGHFRISALSSIWELAIQLVCCVVLTRYFGLIGTAMAAVIGVSAGIVSQIRTFFSSTKFEISEILKSSFRILKILVPLFVCWSIVRISIPINTIVGFCCFCILYALSSAVYVVALEESFSPVRSRVVAMFGRA